MSDRLSPVISSAHITRGPFSVNRFDLQQFGGRVNPLMGMDHYRMNDVTFAPHPHAGFSAVSYIFEDSKGALRNRDSLGHDFDIAPGGIVWTQAGSGVVHDELPTNPGTQVHGLQIFVNLHAENKSVSPAVFRLSPDEIPVWSDAAGNKIRIVVGEFAGVVSSLKPLEPFNLFDMYLMDNIALPVAKGWNAMIYVEDGSLSVSLAGETRELSAGDAVGLIGGGDTADLITGERAHIVVLSGRAIDEPVLAHGPFIMNNAPQINAAIQRYQRGDMGVLPALS